MGVSVKSLAEALWARLGRLAYGADYNPEQWDDQTWAEDVKLMVQAGVNLVTLGIFAWASLQPSPDRFEPRWLDRVMDLLADNGISVCLATATASPPPWLVEAHPDILPVDECGHTLWHGSRQHFCPSSPAFREAAQDLVERLANHYQQHPALAAWHVGNEYGCHVARCYCETSARDFRRWLRQRYGDIGQLNDAWSTAFWSQRYTSWEQIIPPRKAPTFQNPAQTLDFFRFSSDALLTCYEGEAAILRRLTPSVPVTTNFLPFWQPVDAFSWASHVDLASLDSYPDPGDPDAACQAALSFGLMRGASNGKSWLLMEQAPSAVNWRDINKPKTPELYRLWTWQAIAHGANGALSFQWRASRGGAEKWHSAMVPHAGANHSIYHQVAEVGKELASTPSIAVTEPVRNDVALVFDWASWWALELPSRPSSLLRLLSLLTAYHRALWYNGIVADVVPPSASLEKYRLLIVPNLYLTDNRTVNSFSSFTERGGHLAIGFFSGLVDPSDRVYPGPYPGALRDLLGVQVDQFWPLEKDETVPIRLSSGQLGTASLWSEQLHVVDAQVEATFAGGPLSGQPALTTSARGKGTTWYFATLPDGATLRAILSRLCISAGVAPAIAGLPPGVEALRRRGQREEFLFLLNHNPQRHEFELPAGWVPLVSRGTTEGQFDLDGQQVAVLCRPT